MIATGTQALNNGAVGESARGYDLLDHDALWPASMKLLGDWNWYLPRALERLPRTTVEAPAALARRDLD